ncbi:decorin-binding protein DbpA [Borreliella tanukii]|uniref:decorin-binding protein DbpA n=1 Tax=Borreliella tanukii TaxID=56146 RepID=UPI0026497057|nr:decorin-binding protein DbpA [Borreliella tanukii]WKC82136.1 decorin-binding protein DbpA [Borreliella tanukii]
MNKYNKNLIKLTLIASLFAACALTGKARLESSVQDVTNEIAKAVKEAKQDGVDVEAIKEGKKTGAKMGGPKTRAAKVRVIGLSTKFLKEVEEEATSLKENGGVDKVAKDELLKDMYNLMLRVSRALQDLGLQDMEATVTQAAEETPPTTAEGILEIAKKMKEKLVRIEGKQNKNNATT